MKGMEGKKARMRGKRINRSKDRDSASNVHEDKGEMIHRLFHQIIKIIRLVSQ